jgi:hypothetical protein
METKGKKSAKQIFAQIQKQLETLQDSDESFLFLARQDNRGVVNGDDEELVSLVLFNMLKYEVVADIFSEAVAAYNEAPEHIKQHVRGAAPTHEVFTIDGKDQLLN